MKLQPGKGEPGAGGPGASIRAGLAASGLRRCGTAFSAAIMFLVFAGVPQFAQSPPYSGSTQVVVTSDRIPVSFKDTNRSIVVITQKEIREAPVHSVQELLSYVGGVDVRQRGPLGVQADVSIRGATFNQTLVLINGVPVNDPQTGHHNMDLPVTLDDIQKIEILRGAASSVYGPGAFGGVINIITKKGESDGALLSATWGQNGLRGTEGALSFNRGALGTRISASRTRDDGYRPGSDFDVKTAYWGGEWQNGQGHMDYTLGLLDKKFGANGFYTSLFPQAWEHTKTVLFSMGQEFQTSRWTFQPRLFWRRHTDRFLLDRNDPSFYENDHTTHSYGLQLQGMTRIAGTEFVAGGDFGGDSIRSNRLGDRTRSKSGVFVEDRAALTDRLNVVLGAYGYHYSRWGWHVWPGLDLGYQLTPALRPYLSVTKSFRVPTYTELYYADPVNKGNSELNPESAWSYEAGMRWQKRGGHGDLSVFRRDGRDLIDWIRYSDNSPWRAENTSTLRTTGAELDLTWLPRQVHPKALISRISFSYTYLHESHPSVNYQSEYLLAYLRQQAQFELDHAWTEHLSQDWSVSRRERVGFKSYTMVDTRLTWSLRHFSCYIQASNLFDASYEEIGNVPMPGRWITGGIRFTPRFGNSQYLYR
jgi:vitamin B12 transporter